MRIAVTGANGHLGRRLIAALGDADVRAVVRSERARTTLLAAFGDTLDIAVVDYGDSAGLARVLENVDRVVHLVGIVKESRANPFEVAHEGACRALVDAASSSGGVDGIVYLSILGSDAASPNPCLSSRGRAEDILLASSVPVRVIRVPMVLGEGDYASLALKRQARSRVVFTFRSASLEQPIYAGDVVDALAHALDNPGGDELIELAGPESLSRTMLIERARSALGHKPGAVISLPLSVGMLVAGVLERLANPPVTRAMLGVLDHDDCIDVGPACERLHLDLTPLDETLSRVMENSRSV